MEEEAMAAGVVEGVVAVEEIEKLPQHFLLQWHITDRCNLRCRHCYQQDYHKDELSFEKLVSIFEQFKDFIVTLQQIAQHKITAHITITGGEPFIRKDFGDLLCLFHSHQNWLTFGILTNGSFIDEKCAKYLKQLQPSFVQLSLEGTEKTHDHIRGIGHFKTTLSAIKQLRKQQIKTLISFTAHRDNYQEFQKVAEIGRQSKVNRVWSDRLIPQGSGAELQTLNSEETLQLFQMMAETKQRFEQKWFHQTEVALHRALQFLVGGNVYRCNAGKGLLTIQPNGDVYPCRRMPIKVGNVFETPLLAIYQHHYLLQQLRDSNTISQGCEKCFYQRKCRGGLKCLSYALTGDPFQADPSCWLKTN
ncbi:MAG: hypothetical protein RIT27_1238 [Pseudomonadota bacterium]